MARRSVLVIIPEKGSNGSRVGQRGTSHNTSLWEVSALATGSLEARMTLQSWLKQEQED